MYYEKLAQYERDGFQVIVDKTYEDIPPSDQFEADEVDEICRKIDDGTYDYFMLRVRVMFDGHEMGSHYLGGCLYEDAEEVLTDGTAEDCISEALHEAKDHIKSLREKLSKVAV